jgi:NAD+ kinase
VKRVGILYHPHREEAHDLADKIEDLLSAQGLSSWQCSAWDEDRAKLQVASSDLVLSIGGDGTILHVARIIVPLPVPILGINMGRLGFITELDGSEVLAKLPGLLKDGGWIEERAMLQAEVGNRTSHALNDVVVRSTAVNLVSITVEIDGELLTIYRGDGIIVATATGSTAYSLAAGGPILHPQSKEIVLQPISCHLGLNHPMVLSAQSTIDLTLATEDKAVLSLDGQLKSPFLGGHNARVKLSPYIARFLRTHQPTYFYSTLRQKLRGMRA